MQRTDALESIFVWTSDALYEIQPRGSPSVLFERLLSVGRTPSDAEAVGATAGIDMLSIYEQYVDFFSFLHFIMV